jgi:hypothetical protein
MLNNPRHSDWSDETTLLVYQPARETDTPEVQTRRDFEEFMLISSLEGGSGGRVFAASELPRSNTSAKVASA